MTIAGVFYFTRLLTCFDESYILYVMVIHNCDYTLVIDDNNNCTILYKTEPIIIKVNLK